MIHAALAIPGALSRTECEVLHEVARTSGARTALEVGHWCGRSTVVLLDALPPDCALVTVDHHRGDAHAGPTSFDDFIMAVRPHIGDRPVVAIPADIVRVLRLGAAWWNAGYDFVFYDADHSRAGVEAFWRAVVPWLAPRCTLVYDDADWTEQATLGELARAEGFTAVTGREFVRGEDDKADPATYTLEVLQR